ncbi:hypothetical protein MPTK1_1g00310 [Marchantia polymorpha subsp. ruderalis]|uniref:Transmembrane protein n=2 Tax=Marchantia polymorpha TaxID=3197 RepID=A0AAF6AJX0_MARPO|nr:hypothetical protein MARPO_0103s0056 [Marchantia polymorpha]BBM96740.1 hypothetical protein Mp_1g00310 [Marchantia polymorpha subsp. ruderalis]|eukprot:PTQ32088.1 hypothetical protein MARPO_0103s0056 [Marchantia polymorpha]
MDVERFTRCESGAGEEGVEDEGMGPIDLLREALKLVQDPYHIATFACIHMVIVVPATVMVLVTQWFVYEVVHKLVLEPPQPPAPWPDMWLVALIYVALWVGGLVLAVNLDAAVYFTVGCMYSGRSVTFRQVIQALPGLWRPLFLTAIWGNAFFVALGLSLFVAVNVLTTFASMLILPVPVFFVLTVALGAFVFFIINTTLQLACGVTVFEGVTALDAFARALALAKNQWSTALGLLLIEDVPGLVLSAAFTVCVLSSLDGASKLLLGSLLVVPASFFRTLSSTSYALFYFSTKACHHEPIHFPAPSPASQFEAGYQSLAALHA